MTEGTQTAEISIDALAAGGDGVGRAPDGRVVFVPFTAPGDRVEVALEPGGKRFVRGSVRAVVSPSPLRTEPPCPVFGACGGCAWQHVAYEAQVAAKRTILRDALVRIGRVDGLGEIPFTACPSPYAYRWRARVVVAGGLVGYRRRRSNAVCATARCPILLPAAAEALAALSSRPPAEEGEWEIAVGGEGDVRVTRVGAPSGRRLAVDAAGELIERSPGVFAQSNALLLEPLLRAVWRAAGAGERLLELFAGAGFFTVGLARRFAHLVAAEGDAAAAADLAHNAARTGLGNVEVRCEGVDRTLAARRERPDVVVLDPPRSGVPRGLCASLAAIGARRIVYLSCDPATLARDVSELARAGYALVAAEGFDLFPQTPHLEALVTLDASSEASP